MTGPKPEASRETAPRAQPWSFSADWRAATLAALGLLLLTASPPHRVDLPLYGALAVATAAAWRPGPAVAAIGAALPFFGFGRDVGPVSFSAPGLALVLVGLGALSRAVWDRFRRPRRGTWLRAPTSPLDLPLAGFLVAALVSLLVTEYPRLSVRELRSLILEPVLFFWLLRVLRGLDADHWAVRGFLASAVVAALAALLQSALGLGGTEAEGVRRAQAWYPSPNHLALMLGRALPLLLAESLAGGHRWLGRAGALLTAAAMAVTFSLGAILGGLASTIAVLLALGRRRGALRLGSVAVALLLGVAVLGLIGVLPERLNPLRPSSGFRVELWLSSLAMIRDHPLLGVGLDNFVYLYQQVYLREGGAAEPNLSHPHNWVLHLWLQLGVLGLLSFVTLCWKIGRAAYGSALGAAEGGDRGPNWLAVGVLGALVATLVHGLIDNSYFLPDLAALFWLGAAVAFRQSEPARR
ncbi:MAG: O-antigen ligase family protein [Chloroflexi bacterium]|nr:O-antigen ligase family protein [Chloroflexota bacterium]